MMTASWLSMDGNSEDLHGEDGRPEDLLRSAEDKGGKVTAATSSQTTDAAAYVILMDERFTLAELGIKPIAQA